jgi:hypothetical protein
MIKNGKNKLRENIVRTRTHLQNRKKDSGRTHLRKRRYDVEHK